MTDNGARALAERLHVMLHNERGGVDDDLARIACQQAGYDRCNRKAAAILANGAVFLPDAAELDRLRAAAQDVLDELTGWHDDEARRRVLAALRAALRAEGSAGT